MFIQSSTQQYQASRLVEGCDNKAETSARTSKRSNQPDNATKTLPTITQKASLWYQRSKMSRQLTNPEGPEALLQIQVKSLARNKAGFHSTIKQVYGDNYRDKRAESLRQQSLDGNFDWLPAVRYVDADTLNGANGAYDFESEMLLLSDSLAGTDLAAQAFIEEAGKHLDTVLNIRDY